MKIPNFSLIKENLYLVLLAMTVIPRVFPYGATISDALVALLLVFVMIESRIFIRHRMDRFQALIALYSTSLLILNVSVAFYSSNSLLAATKSYVAFMYLFIGYTLLKSSEIQFDKKVSRLVLVLVLIELVLCVIQLSKFHQVENFRATGTFLNPNLLGSLIGAFGLFALYTQTSKKILVLTLGISSILLLLSASMGSILAFSLSVFVYLYFESNSAKQAKTPFLSVAPWVMFPVGLFFVVVTIRGLSETVYSFRSRLVVWRESTKNLWNNPLAPAENVIDWKIAAPGKLTNWSSAVTTDAHNDFLNFMLEGGIVGGVFYLALFGILMKFVRGKYLAGIIYLFLSGLTSSVLTYSWLMLLIAYLVHRSSPKREIIEQPS
jgi:O-antigen ligase